MKIQTLPATKTSKYKNKRCVVNGVTFASKREAGRYTVLFTLQRAGKIHKLQMQQRFPIIVNGVKVCTYVADFVYYDASGTRIVEDVKGMRTDIYKLKKKLLHATTGIDIIEV